MTAHGFPSVHFRDYAGDETPIAREVCEAALGHVIGGVEAAYRRGDALQKRRELMSMWSAYCASPPPALPAGGYDAGAASAAADNVLPFTARASRGRVMAKKKPAPPVKVVARRSRQPIRRQPTLQATHRPSLCRRQDASLARRPESEGGGRRRGTGRGAHIHPALHQDTSAIGLL